MNDSVLLQLGLALILDVILLGYLLRPRKPFDYRLYRATPAQNGQRRAWGREEMGGVQGLGGFPAGDVPPRGALRFG